VAAVGSAAEAAEAAVVVNAVIEAIAVDAAPVVVEVASARAERVLRVPLLERPEAESRNLPPLAESLRYLGTSHLT
jgi:hypothetical protein